MTAKGKAMLTGVVVIRDTKEDVMSVFPGEGRELK